MKRLAIAFAALFTCAAGLSAASDPAATAERFAQMYIAPMEGSTFWRLYDPDTGVIEFRRMRGDMSALAGAAGWSGVRAPDGTVTIRPPAADGEAPLEFSFGKDGKPTVFSVGGVKCGIDTAGADIRYPGAVPPMWDDDPAMEDDPLRGKWVDRFTLFDRNPNRFAVLACALALLALCGLARRQRLLFALVWAVAFAVFAAMLFFSGSRGSLFGFAAGAAFIAGVTLWRHAKSKFPPAKVAAVFAIAALAALAIAAASICAWMKSRGWLEDYGTALRFELLRGALRMMADAPGGWADAADSAASAYMSWYQPLDRQDVFGSLISAHTTQLAELGWIGRYCWIAGWLAAILLPAKYALRGGSPLPCAAALALCIAAFFNPVLAEPWLICAPTALIMAWWLWRARPWTEPRFYAAPAAVCAVAALAGCIALKCAGEAQNRTGGIAIRCDGGRVAVNGSAPDVWVLDDFKTLGWILAPREIRFFCESVEGAPAIGYATRLEDVPDDCKRLIAGGERCRDFLAAWRRREAPRVSSLVFVSPTFAPSEVPQALRRETAFCMVVGEFAARYLETGGSGALPDWVAVAPGAETYIPGWVSFCIAR